MPGGRGGTTRDGGPLWKHSPLVREAAPEALVVLSADAVYRMDYDEVVRGHLDSGAAVTMVTATVDRDDTYRYGAVVTCPVRVLDELDAVAADLGEDPEQIGDLGDHLLPRLVAAGEARAYRFGGCWRDVGTVGAYWPAHMDLLGPRPAFDVDDPDWPILTRGARTPPARLARTAAVADSLVAGGAVVAGEVDRSVVSAGAVVERGAVVRRSVLLPGAVVRSGVVVEKAVVDSGTTVGRGCRVGTARGKVALVGGGAVMRRGTEVPAGGRWPLRAGAGGGT